MITLELSNMKGVLIVFSLYFAGTIDIVSMHYCGCRELNPCYKKMLETILDDNEEPCVGESEIGTISVTIFLKALEKFCGEYIIVNNDSLTFENRNLYEAVLRHPEENDGKRNPVIFVEAGQQGGIEPVIFAMTVIEQLIACKEHNEYLKDARWVILPNTNPDGREFTRYGIMPWRKNMRTDKDNTIHGVDITRNFDESFHDCGLVSNGFSHEYQGPKPLSEAESSFITSRLNKHKNKLRAYVSIKRDGHSLLYPFASTNATLGIKKLKEKAADIAAKVNQKSGFIGMLVTRSINEMEGKPHCGHSVDYVFNKFDQPYAYELRMYLENDVRMMSKFQSYPRGYENTLKMGYMSILKELYLQIVADSKSRNRKRRLL